MLYTLGITKGFLQHPFGPAAILLSLLLICSSLISSILLSTFSQYLSVSHNDLIGLIALPKNKSIFQIKCFVCLFSMNKAEVFAKLWF